MSQERIVFLRRASGLVRELSATDVVIWAIASPAASGMLYYQVATANKYPGANPVLSFLIGTVIILPIVVTLAYMLQIMPRSGGMYVCISRILDPSLGYLGTGLYVFGEGMCVGVMAWVGTGVLGSAFALAGHTAKVTGLVQLGEWLSMPTGRTIVSLILVVVFWALALVSMRAVKVLTRVLFVIPMLATLALILIAISAGGNAEAAFDRTWGAGVYRAVLDAARAHGWSPPAFSWSSTIGLLLVVFWAFVGWESVTFAAGEVKNPKRSLLGGLIGGFLLTGILYAIVAWAAWHPYTRDQFIGAYTFLYDVHPDVLKSIMPISRPSVPLFLGSLVPNPWLAVLLMVMISFWFYNTIPPVLVATSRAIFALSFDRALPKQFASVNRRGVPTWATHAAMVFGIIAVVVFARDVSLIVAMLDITTLFIFWMFGLSAVMLPLRRPDIYRLSPVQRDVLGVPLISLLGLVSTAVGWFFVLFAAAPLKSGPQVGLCVLILLLYSVYLYSQQRAKQEGIDVSAIYAEIPPE